MSDGAENTAAISGNHNLFEEGLDVALSLCGVRDATAACNAVHHVDSGNSAVITQKDTPSGTAVKRRGQGKRKGEHYGEQVGKKNRNAPLRLY
jgi:hypothetical protein